MEIIEKNIQARSNATFSQTVENVVNNLDVLIYPRNTGMVSLRGLTSLPEITVKFQKHPIIERA